MAFDGFFYRKQARLLAAQLNGAFIDKIYQIGRYDLYLQLKQRTTKRLLISVQPDQARLLLIEDKPTTPAKPTMFTMLLRKHLQSARIERIEQVGLDRIIDVDIATKNQIGDAVNYKLRVEIMGKHSNLMLIDASGTIVDAIKRVGPNISVRPILANVKYQLPPSMKRDLETLTAAQFDDILATDEGGLQKALYKHFAGVSPTLATAFCRRSDIAAKQPYATLTDAQRARLWQTIQGALAELADDRIWLYRQGDVSKEFSAIALADKDGGTALEAADFQTALLQFYQRQRRSNQVAQKAAAALKRIDLLTARTKARIANLENDLTLAADLATYQLYGELLTANLHAVKKGMTEVTLFNYYDNQSIVIPLAADKAPNENAQYYYKRYNKAKTTLQKASVLIAQNQSDLAYFRQVRNLLEHAESVADVAQLNEELADGGWLKSGRPQRKKRLKKLPPLQYRSSEGVEILVGRNNYQNDELTTKRAAKSHIWLHSKDIAGSHVIITRSFAEIAEQTIVEAAMIAAYHSDARYSSQVPVDFTEVKHVKKPKGAKPGMVIFSDNKTIYVNPDKETIAKLRVDKVESLK